MKQRIFTTIKLLVVAIDYGSLGAAYGDPDSAFAVLAIVAFAANALVIWHSLPSAWSPQAKGTLTILLALMITFAGTWAYKVYRLNNYPV
jgi:uncharacterized membrane protein